MTEILKCTFPQILRLGRSAPSFTYSMGDYAGGDRHNLDVSPCQKDLGVLVDNELAFRDHIPCIVAKANGVLGVIRRIFRFLDSSSLLLLYKSMVHPIIEYGIPAWSPFLWKDIDEIDSIQRRATKMVPGLREVPYPERLRRLDLPCLRYRRLRGDMIYMYKYLTGDMAGNATHFQRAIVSSTRGHPLKIHKPRCIKSIRQRSCAVERWLP